jgi:uncharacterized repeat protein (TIGR01451 family)
MVVSVEKIRTGVRSWDSADSAQSLRKGFELRNAFAGSHASIESAIRKKGIRLLLPLVGFLLLISNSVFAAGTPAGTAISNQAYATYQAGNGQPMPPISSNVVTVIVAQLGAVNIAPASATSTTQVNTNVDYPSTVTNSGNGTDNILLSASSSLGFVFGIYHDVNRNGVLDPSELAAGTISQTGNLLADSSYAIITRVVVPNNAALNGQTDLLTLTGTSAFEPTAQGTAAYSTIIASATLSFTKSVNNTVPRGGDRVTYTIAYSNTGSGDATNVVVTDVLDNNLNYVIGSSTPPPVNVSGRTITWNLGTITAGGTGSIAFQVDLINNAVPGTEIHNVAQIQYNDGPNLINIASSEANFITVQSGGVVTVDFGPNRSRSGEPGDTVDYAFTLTNNGTLPESFVFSYSSNQSLTWTYYHDANGNGTIDSSESPTTTTGPVPGSGGQYYVVARTILPVVPADGTMDATAFTVTSTANPGNAASASGTTTIFIPVMSLVKLADAPDPKPGREIRYQITYNNSGNGHAIQFSVTDAIPANTTYIPQSVVLNGVPKTDEADTDEVTVSNGVVTVQVGTVNPLTSGVFEFRVRIN